jgi:hypothetical protein
LKLEVRVTLSIPVLSLVLLYFGPGQTPKTAATQVPPVSNAPVLTQGKLERQSVRYHVRLQQPAVRYCYVQELGRRPDLKVEVAVEFTVGPNGQVSGCAGGTSAIGQCVAKAICRIRFPAVYDALQDGTPAPSRQSTQIRYRFRFQPTPKRGDPTGRSPPDPIARDRAADDADDAPAPAASPTPPGTTTPAPAARPPDRPAPARKTRPGLLRRPRSDDPLDGIDSAGDQL